MGGQDKIYLVNKITKRMANKQVKVNGHTTGLVPSDPTMTADEYLEKMEEKYYWRVFGPTEKHRFVGRNSVHFDLADPDTWPLGEEADEYSGRDATAYVRYGSIKVVGTDSIIEAKISPKKFDLRCVDSTAGYVHWQSEEKKVLFEKMRPLCAKELAPSPDLQNFQHDEGLVPTPIDWDTRLAVPWLVDQGMVGEMKKKVQAKEEPKKKVQAKEEPKKKVQAKEEPKKVYDEGTPDSTPDEEYLEMTLKMLRTVAVLEGCDRKAVKKFALSPPDEKVAKMEILKLIKAL